MLNRIVTGAFAVATLGFGVVAAQHTGQHQSPPHESRTDHAICGAHHAVASQAATQHHATAAAPSSHAAALPAELKLTEKQAAEIDRLTTEACAAMAKYHEQIMAVLTPEQKARMMELHGGGHADSPLAAFFRKLHGGR